MTVAPNSTVSTSVVTVYDVVSLTFTVTPTTITDVYNVTLNVRYSTTLPKPALQVTPYSMQFSFFPEDLSNGKFPVEATISETVALESAGDALREWSESPQSFTKILVDMDAAAQ